MQSLECMGWVNGVDLPGRREKEVYVPQEVSSETTFLTAKDWRQEEGDHPLIKRQNWPEEAVHTNLKKSGSLSKKREPSRRRLKEKKACTKRQCPEGEHTGGTKSQKMIGRRRFK